MMGSGTISVAVMMASIMMSGAAVAQSAPGIPPVSPQPPRKPVDPAVGDVSPLSASFRDMRVDLRQPVGFEHVYRVPGRDDLLMRSSGALSAVFPQSAYVRTSAGLLAVIPAGTVFYIGDPSQAQPSVLIEDEELLPGQISTRVQRHQEKFLAAPEDRYIDSYLGNGSAILIPQAQQQPSPPPVAPRGRQPALPMQPPTTDAAVDAPPTVANDDSYRQRRIGELIAQAATSASREVAGNSAAQ